MYMSLNPCFNGICSARNQRKDLNIVLVKVLILVLMEYALRVEAYSFQIKLGRES